MGLWVYLLIGLFVDGLMFCLVLLMGLLSLFAYEKEISFFWKLGAGGW